MSSESAATSLGRILVIEDDTAVGALIRQTLSEAGYSCEVEPDGLCALSRCLAGSFDLLILDINLPRLSGLDICAEIKKKAPDTQVIMLTARAAEVEVVTGLEVGADDYMVKPFRPLELLARVRSRLRERTRRAIQAASTPGVAPVDDAQDRLVIGEFAIDFLKMRVTLRGKVVELSPREFEFLALLSTNPGRPFTHAELTEHVWQNEGDESRTNISVFVARLRKKIEKNPEQPEYILTARGIGYRFTELSELGGDSAPAEE